MDRERIPATVEVLMENQYRAAAKHRVEELPLRGGIDREVATLIATGPSMQQLMLKPELAKGAITVINAAGVYWIHLVDYWVTLHSDMLEYYAMMRMSKGYDMEGIVYIGRDVAPNVNKIKIMQFTHGSSALYAIGALQLLGYKKVYLFGVDLIGWYERFRKSWKNQNITMELVQCEGAEEHWK